MERKIVISTDIRALTVGQLERLIGKLQQVKVCRELIDTASAQRDKKTVDTETHRLGTLSKEVSALIDECLSAGFGKLKEREF